MKRGQYKAVKQRNTFVLEKIKQLKADHPFWGYRRVWANLNYVYNIPISKNTVHRLMKENNLTVARNERLRAKRKITTSKPKPTRPNQWWGIDMTKVMTEGGWVYIVIVIDWYTKKVVGHYAGTQSKSSHWLIALNKAVNTQFPHGIKGHNLSLMSDNGCQPTSTAFIKDCGLLGIKQAFTSYNNPKGNADTERFMRTLKEEFAWLSEWKNPHRFCKDLDEWVKYYNTQYLHSTLGYKTPDMFEGIFFKNNQQNILLNYAC